MCHFLFFFSILGPVDHITTAMSQSHLDDDDEDQPPGEEKETVQNKTPKKKKKKKQQMCQRHVQQLFVRGEQIVLVAVLAT